MTSHMTRDARAVSMLGYEHVRRLGHRHFGGEHFLLALASAAQPVGAILREYGVTPERVEQEIVRRAGAGPASALLADLDRETLAVVGIDLGAVRARIEGSFDQQAIAWADHAVHGSPGSWQPGAGAERDGYFVPHSAGGIGSVQNARREAAARQCSQVGVEHLALGVLAVDDEPVPSILAALNVSASALRASILDRYRQAS